MTKVVVGLLVSAIVAALLSLAWQSLKAEPIRRCWNCEQIYKPSPQRPNCPYCGAPPNRPPPQK